MQKDSINKEIRFFQPINNVKLISRASISNKEELIIYYIGKQKKQRLIINLDFELSTTYK